MEALVMPNLEKPNAAACTRAVIERLCGLGITGLLDIRFREAVGDCGGIYVPFGEGIGRSELIIAIGGDGTILHSSKHAVEHDKPLLGVNVGRLGFLSSLEMSELELLSGLVTGDCREERRMLLECVHDADGLSSRYLALNDVVITNGAVSRMIELDVECDGVHTISCRADGVILSTPTGSTAYALSAGGPITEPSVNCILLTPVCPHSLMLRTMIFSENRTITVRVAKKNRNPVYLTIDGDQGSRLKEEDRLEVRRSARQLRLITLKQTGFTEVLSNKFKLHWTEESSKDEGSEDAGGGLSGGKV